MSNPERTTLENSLVIPAGRAALISVSLAIAATCAGLWWEWDKPLALGGLLMGLSFPAALAWYWSKADDLLHPQAHVCAPDAHAVETVTIHAQVVAIDPSGAYSDGKLFDFRVDPVKFRVMCERILAGANPTLSEFGGRGKLFTRSEFEAIRAKMIERGMMYWINPHATSCGAGVTAGGRAFFRHAIHDLPLPHEDPVLPVGPRNRAPLHAHTRTHGSDQDRWRDWRAERGIPQ